MFLPAGPLDVRIELYKSVNLQNGSGSRDEIGVVFVENNGGSVHVKDDVHFVDHNQTDVCHAVEQFAVRLRRDVCGRKWSEPTGFQCRILGTQEQ